MMNKKFSIFQNAAGEKLGDYSLEEIARIIVEEPETKTVTSHLRKLMEDHGYDAQVVTKYKRENFKMFKPLGQFNELSGNGFVPESFTGLCPFDIDRKDHPELGAHEWDDLYVRIMGNPHVVFVMESPRGGIKGGILLDYQYQDAGDWYELLTHAVYPKFENEWGVRMDAAQARMHMGQFLSHDPYAHFNAAPEPFKPSEELRPTKLAPKWSKEDFRVKKFQWVLDELKTLQGGQVFQKSKDLAVAAAKMVKGGSLPLTPDEVKYLMWECLKQAPGVSLPKKARTDIWNAFDWAFKNETVIGISDQDLAFEKTMTAFVKELKYSKWRDGECPYIAVGNDFFWITPPDVSKKEGSLQVFRPETIRRQHPRPKGLDVLSEIPFYRDFISKPNFLNYEKIVDGLYYNETSPLPLVPVEGEFPTITGYIQRLFGKNTLNKTDQVDLFLDFMKIMLEDPKQKVPIMALVSKVQGTGKSFLFELLVLIFGEDNCKMLTYKNFIASYNRSWANKYIVFIDEVPDNKSEEFYTLLKEITYQKNIDVTEKYMTNYEIENYIHFFITSNNVDSFVKIEDQDSRMWIREVDRLERKDYDKDIFKKIKKEACHFLHYLLNRQYVHDITHRFAFERELYKTERWEQLVENQKSSLYHHLKDQIREDFELHRLASDNHVYQSHEVKELLSTFQYRWSVKELRKAMDEFGAEYKNNNGKKGWRITREMVDAEPVQVRNGGKDQSDAFKLL